MQNKNLNTGPELFTRISEGNEDAFNEFYVKILPEFSPYLYKMLKSEDAVKEVLQESLVRFWINRHRLPEINHPKAWLSRIITNECYRYLRKRADQQRATSLLNEQNFDSAVLHQTEMDISFRETQRIIRQVVMTLSPRQKTIYQLSREAGLTIPEIAERLGLSANYVKKTLMLALHIIQRRLIEAGRLLPLLLF